MSDAQQGQQPQSGPVYPGPPAGQYAPTEWLGSGSPPPGGYGPGGSGSASGGGRRRALIVGAVVGVLALVGGGAVLAFQVLGGGGPQPDEAIPAGVVGYVRIDLDPSAEQKVNAFRLLQRIPQFEEETGISADTDDVRQRFYDEAVADSEDCPDYTDGVEPWLGERAGLGVMPTGDGEEPDGMVVLQVSDQAAAEEGLRAIAECTGEDDSGVAFVGDYALVAETQELADSFAADAEEAPLSEDADYSADMDALDDEGIVSAWVDVEASIAEYLSADEDAAVAASGLSDISSVAMSVRAGSDNIEVGLAADGVPADFGDPAEAVQTLPSSTLFALGFSGGAGAIESGWAEVTESMEQAEPGSVEDFTTQLEDQTGLRFPDDVQTLVGDDFALAVDSEGLELDPTTGEPDLSTLPVGVRTSSDVESVADLVGRIETALTPFAPLDLVEQEVDGGGSVIAFNEEYADMLAADGDLGDSGTYQSAVEDPDDAALVYYLDFDQALTLVDRIGEETDDEMHPDDREALEVLRAFGLSATVDGDYTKATARLVFD